MRIGGAVAVRGCSFLSNYASTRGYAIAAVSDPVINGSLFDGNDAYCTPGSYRTATEEVKDNGRH